MAAKSEARLYEPSPRSRHSSCCVNENTYILFGDTRDNSNDAISKLSQQVEVFNSNFKTWDQKKTTGTPPPSLIFSACTSIGNRLYQYGGIGHGTYSKHSFSSTLSQLDTSTMEWKHLSSNIGPMKKHGAGMVAFHRDKLALFGGYGIPTSPTQPGASFHENIGERGWTNEFHVFNTSNGTWSTSSPPMTGSKPPPCSDFTFTTVDENRAVLFGGYQPGCGQRVNDVYIIDFNDMNWTKIEPREGESWPVGREYHAACCLDHGGEHPQLLISGGMDVNVLKDCWMLDLTSKKWKKLTLPDDVQTTRYRHSITASTLEPGLVEVIMFGGKDNNFKLLSATFIMRFKFIVSTREWDLVDVVTNRQRAVEVETAEDVRSTSHTPSIIDRAESASMKETIQALEEEKTILQQRVEDAERRLQMENQRDVPTTVEVATNMERVTLSSDSEEPKASAQTSRKDSRIIKVDRQLNIVVYGVPENKTAADNSRLSRQENDLSKVKHLIRSLDESIPVESIKECYRLGRYQRPHHPRPLLVRLSRKSQVKIILSKQSQLGGSYYIKPDMSPEELAAERLLLKERWSLIQSGEAQKKDIKINKESLYVNHELHATVKDSQLVKTQANNHSQTHDINVDSS